MMIENEILLVDGDPDSLGMVASSLEDSGYNVTIADNGDTAIDMIGRHDYDLVLSELVVGSSNGLDILNKARKRNPGNAIIILTDHPEKLPADDLMELDIDAYLFKPCEPEKMLTCVSHCLDQIRLKRSGQDRRVGERRQGSKPAWHEHDKRNGDRRKRFF
jgi:DNA-binding NtrC family response regulator